MSFSGGTTATAYQQRMLDVESRSARREFTQCQNCSKDKDRHNIKLSLCTGCKIAIYCSPKCQREHWPKHKPVCIMRRKTFKEAEELDKEALKSATLAGTTGPVLTPSQMIAELRAFTQKFSAALFQAAFNALRLHETEHAWKHCIAFVHVKRLPDLPPDTKPWQHFTVDFISPVPTELAATRLDPDGSSGFIKMKKKYEDEQLEKGLLGGIVIVISGHAPQLEANIYNMTCTGFGSWSKDALKIEASWQETFKSTVERMCGRA